MSRTQVRAGIAALVCLYVVVSALSSVLAANPTDLDAFFLPSARVALEGHPLHVYAVRHDVVYPNANGPLSLLPLTGVAALASGLGWLDNMLLRRALVMAAFSLVALLLAREAARTVDRLRGRPIDGQPRVLLYAAFAAPPVFWHSVLLYGHIEQPLCLWLTLRAVRAVWDGRAARAGITIGLAVLARTVALLYALPLALLMATARRGRGAAVFLGAAAVTVAAGLAPFLIADRPDTVYSLVTFHGDLPIAGGSIWQLAVGTPLERWGQQSDGAIVLLAAAVVAALVAWRRPRLLADERRLFAALTVSAVCFPLLVKTVWPYYFLDVYTLCAIWALGRRAPWRSRDGVLTALVPVTVSLCAFAAEGGVSGSISLGWRRLESAAMFGVLMALAVGVGLSLRGRTAPAVSD